MAWNKLASLVMGAMFIALLSNPAKADWVSITVDISDQLMYVENGNGQQEVYPVSTARKGYRTPYGDFSPYYMTKMHYSRKYNNSPMPNSIFFKGGYAIHATYDVKRLGRPASHGCVRLSPDHAERLYYMVKDVGMDNTSIRIVP
jgi:lipoprotein-anchoring transpeptidase ErfK/SrfK